MPRLPKGVKKHGAQYVFRVSVNGRVEYRPLGPDLTEARRLVKFYRKEFARQRRPRGSVPKVTVAGWADEWLRHYVRKYRKGEKAYRSAKTRLKLHILPVLGKKLLSEVKRADLGELSTSLAEKGLKVHTQRHILSDARCLFNHAVEMDVLELSPFAGKRVFPKAPKDVPNPIPDDELALLLSVCPMRYEPAMTLAYRTGLRWSEQRELEWSRIIDQPSPSIVLHKTKSGEPREIPLDVECYEILRHWREEIPEGKYVMPWRPKQPVWVPRVTMKQEAVMKRGIKWNWHRLRHTFACQWLRDGGSIEVLSRVLGHASITTTERYAKLYNERVRSEFEKVRGIAIGAKPAQILTKSAGQVC